MKALRWLTVPVLAVALVGCGQPSEPPPPTPYGQVCERQFSHFLPIFTGKSTVLIPQYRTVCHIPAGVTP